MARDIRVGDLWNPRRSLVLRSAPSSVSGGAVASAFGFGLFDSTPEELRNSDLYSGYEEQLAAISPFVESVGTDGMYEVRRARDRLSPVLVLRWRGRGDEGIVVRHQSCRVRSV